ncbi:hypothetical protein ID850_17590 [Xenorhabdus sp. Flor]|uniref:DUF7279 family protein n=1 Tax=Xenorhabdus cabanillasii TaxID=351673 RepID=UPI0019AAFAE8|nr:hypothetical protein [Xenorhabdus sp. Flor]MBD2816512.1 hypothetical protein [Xenorhabdus sp. Flor]
MSQYPVEIFVYYYLNRWVLKVAVSWDEDIYLFHTKPTKRQIRKYKKEFIRWSRQYFQEMEKESAIIWNQRENNDGKNSD